MRHIRRTIAVMGAVSAFIVMSVSAAFVGDGGGAAVAQYEYGAIASCEETVNPHGQNVPPAGSTTEPGSRGGQNEDGFYELRSDPESTGVFVIDTGSGTVFGPFPSGTRIKYTEAPGATPSQKKIGSDNGQAGAVDYHITGTGDPVVAPADDDRQPQEPCLVPPPPK